eukprot:10293120-Alexandrium_andersonii.AAC.1
MGAICMIQDTRTVYSPRVCGKSQNQKNCPTANKLSTRTAVVAATAVAFAACAAALGGSTLPVIALSTKRFPGE